MTRQKPSKPRTTSITMDMGKPVEIRNFSVSAEGLFEFFDETGNSLQPVETTLERSYERAKRPKILSRSQTSSVSPISSDPNLVLQQYDTIFALDTNTRQIRGQEVSVACIVLGKWLKRSPKLRVGFSPMHALEFHDVDCHPDLLALKHLILQMESHPKRSAADKIAFIIDSHLGNFPKILSRQLPVLDDCYLPEWADLIYASDAASDSIANILLRASDRAANSLLQQIECAVAVSVSQVALPEHSSYFRVWHSHSAG